MPPMSMAFDDDFAGPTEWARMYRALELQIVPCKKPIPGGQWKRPDLAEWITLQNELVPDATFERWYGSKGDHASSDNMGLLTGKCSGGIFVVDLDVQKTPEARHWWEGVLEANNYGLEPETWQQVTGGGGRQILFRAPEGWTPPTNKTSIGVDIRGQGGFAVLPPSRHESGNAYSWVPGFGPWEMEIETAELWLTQAIDRVVAEHGGSETRTERQLTGSPTADFNALGIRIDGREDYMKRLIWATLVDLRIDCPIPPPENEMMRAYDIYERKVKSRIQDASASKRDLLEKEGRGISSFKAKWKHALAKWDDEIAEEARKKQHEQEQEPAEPTGSQSGSEGHHAPADVYEVLTIIDIKTLPDVQWQIEGMIPADSLGFIYGDPGTGKSFFALDHGLNLSVGAIEFWGRTIKQTGPVFYLAREGSAGFKQRIIGWERYHGIELDDSPFHLIRAAINFMLPDDIDKLLRTVDGVAERLKAAPVQVTVDTVSRVMPGAKENLQEDMTRFVAACDAVRERFGCAVTGVHHASISGSMRGSTVLDGAGDYIFKIERPDEESSRRVLFAEKIKDAEDQWRLQWKLEKYEWMQPGKIAPVSTLIPLKLIQPEQPADTKDGWPDRNVCLAILKAIRESWESGSPWSCATQTRREGRYGPMIMTRQFNVTSTKIAEMMLETWAMNKIITVDVVDHKSKKRGYRVIGSI